MSIPGFTAEASLYDGSVAYRSPDPTRPSSDGIGPAASSLTGAGRTDFWGPGPWGPGGGWRCWYVYGCYICCSATFCWYICRASVAG